MPLHRNAGFSPTYRPTSQRSDHKHTAQGSACARCICLTSARLTWHLQHSSTRRLPPLISGQLVVSADRRRPPFHHKCNGRRFNATKAFLSHPGPQGGRNGLLYPPNALLVRASLLWVDFASRNCHRLVHAFTWFALTVARISLAAPLLVRRWRS